MKYHYLIPFLTKPLEGDLLINVQIGPRGSKPVISANQPVLIYATRDFRNKYGMPEAGTNVTLFVYRMPITKKITEFTITPNL